MRTHLYSSTMIPREMRIAIRSLSMRPHSKILLLRSKCSRTIYYFFIFTIWLLLISTLHLAIQKMNPEIVEVPSLVEAQEVPSLVEAQEVHSLVEVQEVHGLVEVHSLQEQIQMIRRVLIQIQIETQRYEVTVLIPVRISDSPWISKISLRRRDIFYEERFNTNRQI